MMTTFNTLEVVTLALPMGTIGSIVYVLPEAHYQWYPNRQQPYQLRNRCIFHMQVLVECCYYKYIAIRKVK